MTTCRCFLLAAVAHMFGIVAAQAQPPPLRIMPLGDSITYGSGTPGGYRLPLYAALTNSGYNVDYVGTRTDNGATGLPDSNHQGQSGWVISRGNNGLDENLYIWLNVIDDPDVVLLHIGTNDFGTTNDINNAVTRLDNLVTRIATNRPCANIIVTTLLPRNEPYNTQIDTLFNPDVEEKVLAQRALGRKVHFLDMHSYLTTNDMYDTVHPTAAGYAKMADAWHTAVTTIIGPYGDTNAPAISRAIGNVNLTQVTVTFSKALDPATATNLANYAIDGGVSLTAVSLSADQRKVTLTTTPQARDAVYTITVNNVTDVTPSPGPLTIAADTSATFRSVCRGCLANVPEAADYILAYSLDLPSNVKYGRGAVPYSVDNSLLLKGLPIDRIAYYVELQTPNSPLSYLWVSMDAFTNDITKIGVPTLSTGVALQKYLTGLTIQCNDSSIATGSGLLGNLEFWPSNYNGANSFGLPDASGSLFDWGDQPTAGTYGCMQLHNYVAKQTLFTFSNWGTASINGTTPDIGIGNCPSPKSGGVDWTFSNDAGMYSIKTLQIFIRRSSVIDETPPAITSAQAGFAGNLVQVAFSEALAPDSIVCRNFTLDNGVTVIAASLLPDLCTVNLTTTPQPVGTELTLYVSDVYDSMGGNPIAPNASVAVATPDALPFEITVNAGALADGYRLVYTLDIPVKSCFNTASNFYRFNQCSATSAFDRVAYYLELQKDPKVAPQYLWVSMDAFTPYLSKIGVPNLASKAVFQHYVSNLDVKSNVSGISNGTAMEGGNIEFWPYNYSEPNALSITNASPTLFDFGDTRSTSGGHGSMQVHNCFAQQTLFAMNRWGTNDRDIDLGIGNCPGYHNKGQDWTHEENAGSYSFRRLHVLVRPCAAPANVIPAQIAANVPGSIGYKHLYTIDIPVQGDFNTNAAAYYSVNNASALNGSVGRVAYYLELQKGSDPTQYIWTAMDSFTTDASKLGIPVNGTFFQQTVKNLDVLSNVDGVVNGSSFAAGNVEIWPSSYGAANALNIPGANPSTYDFGDGGGSSSGGGHGCMQIHNYGELQTLFAINHFNGKNTVELGIGNNSSGHPDWTFTNNSGSYNHRRLYVLIQPGGDPYADTARPSIVGAFGSAGQNRVTVYFSEALADSSATATNFWLNNGVAVTGASLLPDKNAVQLTTTPLTAGLSYTVTVTGVCDRSVSAVPIIPGSAATFTAGAPTIVLPPFFASVPEVQDYELIHYLSIGSTNSYAGGAPYTVDESLCQTRTFDRTAYCMELTGTNGIAQWVYVSMDAFTPNLANLGVPTANRGAIFQQYVSNLNIYASENVAGMNVSTGRVDSGNIEFWYTDYSAPNAFNIPGASSSTYDFGDSRTSGGTYGSMQVHHYLAQQTLFAFNHFGGNNFIPCLGIGNQPSGNPDWTFNYNGPAYSVKNLYVFVRWGDIPTSGLSGTVPIILSQPRDFTVHERERFYFAVHAMGATRYQWRHNGVWMPGANQSRLEISPADTDHEGVFDVLVFGSGAAYATSAGATLEVISLGTQLIVR